VEKVTAKGSDGTLVDFISGVAVKATPEEIHAVQVFPQLLVPTFRQ
jgi:hypothetical protein